MSDFTSYTSREVPGFPAIVPERTLAAGASETVKPDWRPIQTTVANVGAADLDVIFGSVAFKLLAGATLTVGGPWKACKVHNPSATLTGAYTMIVGTDRRSTAGMPDLTTANGFPAFDASDPNAIKPGV